MTGDTTKDSRISKEDTEMTAMEYERIMERQEAADRHAEDMGLIQMAKEAETWQEKLELISEVNGIKIELSEDLRYGSRFTVPGSFYDEEAQEVRDGVGYVIDDIDDLRAIEAEERAEMAA